MKRALNFVVAGLLWIAPPARAQHYQTDFPPEEFRARWNKVFDRIGADAVAVVQGMPLTNGFIFPRQYNSFYYLPSALPDVEALVREKGIVQKAPPSPAPPGRT